MVDFNLLADLPDFDDDVNVAVLDALGDAADNMEQLVVGDEVHDFRSGSIVKGKISGHAGDDFVVELGLKSEGVLDRGEFDDYTQVQIGDEVEVLLEDVDHDNGTVRISKRKADRILNWEKIMTQKAEGDRVSGKVSKKIKGRPAGGHRRAGVPARQPGRHPPARRDQRLDRPRHRRDDPQDRRGAAGTSSFRVAS